MLIEMLETRRASEDGFSIACFIRHSHYDICEGLARYFIRNRWAQEIRSPEYLNYSH
jgi:hypothetical protein